jgi:hypothetical protein
VGIEIYIVPFPTVITFATEAHKGIFILVPLKSAIEVKQVRFSSNLKFDKDGGLHRISNPEEPPYVGTPSDEIDRAWEELTRCKELNQAYSDLRTGLIK